MSWVIDTSVLVRTLDAGSPLQNLAINALSRLREQDEILCIFPQCLVEFWAVATRPPENNGLGLSVAETRSQLDQTKLHFILKAENESVFENWERLVDTFRVSGKAVHDARIVAAMQTNGISDILNFNISDFIRYSDIIRAVAPQDVK